jgi:hypothetical protein
MAGWPMPPRSNAGGSGGDKARSDVKIGDVKLTM